MANSTNKLSLMHLFIKGARDVQNKWQKLINTMYDYNDLVTFNAGILTDTIAEASSGSGVTISSNRRSIVNVTGSTSTLTAAQSGSLIVLSRAAGITVTLPSTTAGLYYDIFILTNLTSNNYVINGAASSDLFYGGVTIHSTALADKVTQFSPDMSNDYHMTMNGTTTGGERGSLFRITCIATNKWLVSGILYGTGTFTSPFS